jgi:hypothetical protein
LGATNLNELRQIEAGLSKMSETYAIHALQIFLGISNYNILPFGLIDFTGTYLA